MFAIAASGPASAAVEFIVGDGYLAGFAPATDDVLAANERELAVYSSVGVFVDREGGTDLVMIDPNVIRIVQGNRIPSPDILWVQVLRGLVEPGTYTHTRVATRHTVM